MAGVFSTLWTIVLTLFIFGVLIFIHEFGHYIVARLFGVGIKEFSIGMGPKLFSWKGKKNVFSIRALPIGGYVNMVGEYPGEDDDDTENKVVEQKDKRSSKKNNKKEESSGTGNLIVDGRAKESGNAVTEEKFPFNKKPVWQRMLIVLAGPFMNIVLGFVVMAVTVVASDSLPSRTISHFSMSEEFISPEALCFVYVADGENEPNGFMTGDVIIKVDEYYVPVKSGSTDKFTERYSGKEHDFTVLRGSAVTELKQVMTPDQKRLDLGGILQIDDEIIKIGDTEVTAENIEQTLENADPVPLDITVIRDGVSEVIKNVIFPKVTEDGKLKNFHYFSLYVDTTKISSFATSFSSMNLMYIDDNDAKDENALMDGDVILKVDGNPALVHAERWLEFYEKYAGTKHDYRVLRKNAVIDLESVVLPLTKKSGDREDRYHVCLWFSDALHIGDEIINVGGILNDDGSIDGGYTIRVSTDLAYSISRDGINPINVIVKRAGETVMLRNVVFPRYTEQKTYFGNIDFSVEPAEKTFSSVAYNAFFQPLSTLKVTVLSIVDTFSGRYGVEAVQGPIGVGSVVGQMARSEEPVASLATLLVLISLSLGIANLLPLPVLDGGRFFLLLIEAVRRKPLPPKVEQAIMTASMLLVLGLMILIAFKDVFMLWK